jgi:DNA-binding FadR family transcriptional regulator
VNRKEVEIQATVGKRMDSERVRSDLERALLSDRWQKGEKLPTERELCEHYGAARNTVRRALQGLEDAGLIERHVGRGTFRTSFALQQERHGFSPANVVEARLLLEPLMVSLAIARASRADLDRLSECLEAGNRATDLPTFEHWDAEFHDAIALATHNAALVQMSRMLAEVRRADEWGLLKAEGATPERMVELKRQHEAIFNAFAMRNKAKATRSMHDHIKYIQNYMFGN